MKTIKRPSNSPSNSISSTRRKLLQAMPALLFSPLLLAQSSPSPIAVRKLHSYGLRVSDVGRSVAFYQDVFGAAIQSRQGDTVCLRIGDGPRFFSLSPLQAGQQPGISHIGLSVANFDVDAVQDQLATFGVEPGQQRAAGANPLSSANTSWLSTRGPELGGAANGTRELFFADIEGVTYQLSSEDYCGGGGADGASCQQVEEAPSAGLFKTLDLSHFTTFLANSPRANAFYTTAFGKDFQAYQGPTMPVIGVGDGIQFLMYVGGTAEGAPSNPGRIDHVCLSMEDFSVDGILDKLNGYGFTARESASITQPMMHWVSMRMPNRGGIEGGTPEVYFSDPDGISIQLQDAIYCGGGGYLGENCSQA